VTCSTRPADGALRPAIPRRRMVNAILYQARTGCRWRYLPGHVGPWGPIWQQFRRWRAKGAEATTESAISWLHVACVGYLLTKP
jgi:transposase